MQASTKIAAVGMAFGLVFLGTACSSSDAADKITEKAIEKAGGGDVDVDSKDGTVKYTDENGNETEMNIDGEGASLPKDWPADLAPPDSVKLITSSTSTSGGTKTMTVLGEAEGSLSDLAPAVKDQITGAGYEITQDASSEAVAAGYAGLSAKKGDSELTVAMASDTSDKGKVTITMTITSKA